MGHTLSSLATCTELLLTTPRVMLPTSFCGWDTTGKARRSFLSQRQRPQLLHQEEEDGYTARIAPAKPPHPSPKVKEVLTTHPHWVIQLRVLHPDAVHANLYFVSRAIFRWVINEV